MPKRPAGAGPLNCLFAINKPTGHVSMTLLNRLQPLFGSSSLFKDPNAPAPPVENEAAGKGGKRGKQQWRRKVPKVKMGQGGTLDPLADGVLVIGTNAATKHLSKFLDSTKEYRAIGLLGCSTDSYDSEGKRVRETPFTGITSEKIEAILSQYRGEIEQIPPIFSALKMDGKPLYEYARSGTPLPRPIAARKVTVHELSLLRFTPGEGHAYEYPKEALQGKEKEELERLARMVKDGGTVLPEAEAVAEAEAEEKEAPTTGIADARPPIFELSMTVSSGTYVRSIIHDIGIALGSSAHVVKLTRTRQGEFTLNPEAAVLAAPSAPVVETGSVETERTDALPPSTAGAPAVAPPMLETFAGGCIEWEVLESALADLQAVKEGRDAPVRDEDGLLPWEVELLHRCKEV